MFWPRKNADMASSNIMALKRKADLWRIPRGIFTVDEAPSLPGCA